MCFIFRCQFFTQIDYPNKPNMSSSSCVSMRVLNLLQGCGKALLMPRSVNCTSAANFRIKSYLKLKCKYCFFAYVGGRHVVMCRKVPKHKVMEPLPGKFVW
uniref:39S ribosomal protein L36, mitochondrial n=1 Tax=Ditylenchus dipsaci TaxID=166011 RepID=A0A915D8Y2_9BILA